MLDLEVEPETILDTLSERPIPLDRSIVLVRAPFERVLEALEPFSREAPVDLAPALARGQGLDDVLPAYAKATGRRAIVYARRGASEVGIIREGEARGAHDVPLARRLSLVLGAPSVALHVAARDVAYDLFHDGASLERLIGTSGELACAESRFELDEREAARDPYGRALAVLQAYGLADDRLVFEDFARGALVLRRWDVTIERCAGYASLDPWPHMTVAIAA